MMLRAFSSAVLEQRSSSIRLSESVLRPTRTSARAFRALAMTSVASCVHKINCRQLLLFLDFLNKIYFKLNSENEVIKKLIIGGETDSSFFSPGTKRKAEINYSSSSDSEALETIINNKPFKFTGSNKNVTLKKPRPNRGKLGRPSRPFYGSDPSDQSGLSPAGH
ncbi:hypothetical protein BpHYR1_001973 [Brachionus plicatilis]|uniref:Uncharacterized protein n=1 Tax=Brachionus plicatilis TaxID=10195 RepID=A0A3M7S4S9_BRAPC|nr:hypothetical protein BpHYR1_001973 [Brachionus plicatilis]